MISSTLALSGELLHPPTAFISTPNPTVSVRYTNLKLKMSSIEDRDQTGRVTAFDIDLDL